MKHFLCPVTDCNVALSCLRKLIFHLRYVHTSVPTFTCGINECVFKVKSTLAFELHCKNSHSSFFKRKLLPNHSDSDGIGSVIPEIFQIQNDCDNVYDDGDDNDDTDDDDGDINVNVQKAINFEKEASGFLINCREKHRLSTSATQFICTSTLDLMNHHSKSLLTKVNKYFKDNLSDSEKKYIEKIFF